MCSSFGASENVKMWRWDQLDCSWIMQRFTKTRLFIDKKSITDLTACYIIDWGPNPINRYLWLKPVIIVNLWMWLEMHNNPAVEEQSISMGFVVAMSAFAYCNITMTDCFDMISMGAFLFQWHCYREVIWHRYSTHGRNSVTGVVGCARTTGHDLARTTLSRHSSTRDKRHQKHNM